MKLIRDMRARIEAYWDFLQTSDPYNRSILEGRLSPEMFSHFLVNVHTLVQHTPIHLNLAIRTAEARGLSALQKYFEQKLIEESGHDKWAEADIQNLKKRKSNISVIDGTDPTMKSLLLNIESTIQKDPYLYLAYIFFAEYLTVLYGPTMNRALIEKCGYPAESMTVVENHAELDKDHVNDWEDVIVDLVDERIYRKLFLETLDQTITLHSEFFLSCAERKYNVAS